MHSTSQWVVFSPKSLRFRQGSLASLYVRSKQRRPTQISDARPAPTEATKWHQSSIPKYQTTENKDKSIIARMNECVRDTLSCFSLDSGFSLSQPRKHWVKKEIANKQSIAKPDVKTNGVSVLSELLRVPVLDRPGPNLHFRYRRVLWRSLAVAMRMPLQKSFVKDHFPENCSFWSCTDPNCGKNLM